MGIYGKYNEKNGVIIYFGSYAYDVHYCVLRSLRKCGRQGENQQDIYHS